MLRASLAISSCTTRARGIIVNYTIACKLKGRKPELKMFLKQLEHPALMEQQMFPIDQYERKWQLISCRFQQRTRHTITKRNRINPEQANKQANKQTNKTKQKGLTPRHGFLIIAELDMQIIRQEETPTSIHTQKS